MAVFFVILLFLYFILGTIANILIIWRFIIDKENEKI